MGLAAAKDLVTYVDALAWGVGREIMATGMAPVLVNGGYQANGGVFKGAKGGTAV